jgi:hypothetical protein
MATSNNPLFVFHKRAIQKADAHFLLCNWANVDKHSGPSAAWPSVVRTFVACPQRLAIKEALRFLHFASCSTVLLQLLHITATMAPKAASGKAKKAATHPKYSAMIKEAITSLGERTGSSRQVSHLIHCNNKQYRFLPDTHSIASNLT